MLTRSERRLEGSMATGNRRRWSALLLLALGAASGGPLAAQSANPQLQEARPPDLVILQDRSTMEGRRTVGVYGVAPQAQQPELKTVKIWLENGSRIKVRNETIGCSSAAPMRITNDGTNLLMRELNPGGLITPANRLDHQIWWAACFPEQGGKDPALLRDLARRLGYNGSLQERELVLPSKSR